VRENSGKKSILEQKMRRSLSKTLALSNTYKPYAKAAEAPQQELAGKIGEKPS
jgi:hypothetical protein